MQSYAGVCLRVGDVMCEGSTLSVQKGESDPLQLALEAVVSNPKWVLGTKLRSS